MTDRQIENRIKTIKAFEKQVKELNENIDAMKDEIKAEMEIRSTDEITTKNYIVRWKKIISNRLDSRKLKTSYPDIYKAFTTQQETKRFTIA